MSRDNKILLVILIICIIVGIICIVISQSKEIIEEIEENTVNRNLVQNNTEEEIVEKEYQKDVNVVPTMLDKIEDNSSWCATFGLVWNDFKNEVLKEDVVFDPQEKFAENLNKEPFSEKDISEEYYYKTYGYQTFELKEQIEKEIKEKFNQKSDILDMFTWQEETSDIFLYAMLYREFEYEKPFDILDKSYFGKDYTKNDIKYFGISKYSDDELKDQIEVLYYKSDEEFAVKVKTKENDEIIYVKGPEGDTFEEIYNNFNKENNLYQGSKKLELDETFKAPNMKFNVLRDYTELEKVCNNGKKVIQKAIQTIEFEIDNKGGKIKSEAAISTKDAAAFSEEKPREFSVNDTFVIFLKEESKDKPYFAAKVSDITKFQ